MVTENLNKERFDSLIMMLTELSSSVLFVRENVNDLTERLLSDCKGEPFSRLEENYEIVCENYYRLYTRLADIGKELALQYEYVQQAIEEKKEG